VVIKEGSQVSRGIVLDKNTKSLSDEVERIDPVEKCEIYVITSTSTP
jgi:hypothetical protein